jgi:hypothetical protein
VWLPRCFCGKVTIAPTPETIAFSSAIAASTAPLLETQNVQVYFVGERPRRGQGPGGNEGNGGQSLEEQLDELIVGGEPNSVRISWIGEEEPRERKAVEWKSLLNGTEGIFKSCLAY